VLGRGTRRVAVIGPCAASARELATLADQDELDDHLSTAWPGSYTIIAADAGGVDVLTDVGSAWPIYTTNHQGAAVWASSSRALAALSGCRLDVGWLAASLVSPADSGIAGRSAFVGVALVAPGSRLRLRPSCPPRVTRAWQPRPAPAREAVPRLRNALMAGVAARVEPAARPSADCSGGLDSTSLCMLAGRYIQESGRLAAITVHPSGVVNGGDLTRARAALTGQNSIEHVLLPLDGRHAPYRDLDAAPVTDEPAPSTITYARLAAQLRLLAELGSDTTSPATAATPCCARPRPTWPTCC